MPGATIVTDLAYKDALKAVRAAAEDLDFTHEKTEDGDLKLRKGDFALSILVGAFVAYCDFTAYVDEKGKRVTVEIVRNTPWWTGIIGVNRVKTAAKALADRIEDEIEDRGGRVIRREDS